MAPRARRRSFHDPRACRLLRRPKIKHALLHRAAASFYNFITSDKLWPVFVARFPELARLIEHEDRATRSDLRESIGLVAWASLSRTDIKSFRVGWRHRHNTTDGRVFDFVGLPRHVVASWTGLGESTVSRAWSFLRHGSVLAGPGRDGFNIIAQPVEECPVSPKTPNGRRGLPAIRRFFEEFFSRLGLADWLNKLRNPPAPERVVAPAGAAARNVRGVVDELARALGPPPEPA